MEPEYGLGDGEGNRKTVFVDTSLDTHLATIVSDSDTVSDLKGNIRNRFTLIYISCNTVYEHILSLSLT